MTNGLIYIYNSTSNFSLNNTLFNSSILKQNHPIKEKKNMMNNKINIHKLWTIKRKT